MNYDDMIAEQKLIKEKLMRQMEDKKIEIIEEIISFTSDWYEEQTIRTIKDHSDKVLKLGKEKASELKAKITELTSNTKEIVKKHVNIKSAWWHESEKDTEYFLMGNKILPELETPIKYVFGELGSILKEYSLDSSLYQHSKTWELDYASKKMKYDYGVSYSQKLYALSKEYGNLIDSCKKVNKDIASLEDKKSRENIEEWWTSL